MTLQKALFLSFLFFSFLFLWTCFFASVYATPRNVRPVEAQRNLLTVLQDASRTFSCSAKVLDCSAITS